MTSTTACMSEQSIVNVILVTREATKKNNKHLSFSHCLMGHLCKPMQKLNVSSPEAANHGNINSFYRCINVHIYAAFSSATDWFLLDSDGSACRFLSAECVISHI